MLDVKADLQIPAKGLYGLIHLGQDLMLGFVEEPVPQDDLRILHERAPELYEIAVAWPLAFKRGLHELIQPDKTLPGASEVDAAFPRGLLMVFAKTSHAR